MLTDETWRRGAIPLFPSGFFSTLASDKETHLKPRGYDDKFSEGQIVEIPDIETPLPDLPVEVRHDLGGADVLLLHQLAHLQILFYHEVRKSLKNLFLGKEPDKDCFGKGAQNVLMIIFDNHH